MCYLQSQYKSQIRLPSYAFYYNEDAGLLSVRGTWTLQDEKMGFPIQTTTLQCQRSAGNCFETTAVIVKGKYVMPLELVQLPVLSWQNKLVVVEGASAVCTATKYFLNIENEQVTGLRTKKENTLAGECDVAEDQPIKMLMVNPERTTF